MTRRAKRGDISDLEVCRAVAAYQESMHRHNWRPHDCPFPYEALAQKFGVPEKLAFSACQRAYDHGLIEYGTSLRTGWLTDEGKALLLTDTIRSSADSATRSS